MAPNGKSFHNPMLFQHSSPSPAYRTVPQYHTQLSSQASSLAGRKRSRDEASPNLEDFVEMPAVPAPIPESEEDWEYGEGMTLIKPNGFIIDASSQTGTWVEEKLPTPVSTQPVILERQALRSFKSQRLDQTATSTISEDMSLADGFAVAQSPPKSNSTEPTVDDFTIHLGIGWSRISSDEDMQAAARGWAKYIENHFPIADVQIRLQSKGLDSYLVESSSGWFLFGQELKHGRLISTSLHRTFENLKSTPPVFDGEMFSVTVPDTTTMSFETGSRTPRLFRCKIPIRAQCISHLSLCMNLK